MSKLKSGKLLLNSANRLIVITVMEPGCKIDPVQFTGKKDLELLNLRFSETCLIIYSLGGFGKGLS